MLNAGLLAPTADTSLKDLVKIDLDAAAQPFLRDHLVGGRPLLCTVMGIESMACAVAVTRPGMLVAAVDDLHVRPPLILPDEGTGYVEVSVTDIENAAHCTVFSHQLTDSEKFLHYWADFPTMDGPRPRESARAEFPTPNGASVVHAADVYDLYFHGPSFRVIDAAYRWNGRMVGI